MYKNHPVRIDIPGTVESISHIDYKLLYKCYNTFYNLNNMFICVAGNIKADDIIEQVNSNLKDAAPVQIERGSFDEPQEIVDSYVEQKLAVSLPMFAIGYKESCGSERRTLKDKIYTSLLMEAIAGESSPLYKRLFEAGLINDKFGADILDGYGYFASIFEGESSDPRAVLDAINEEISRVRRDGIDADEFERARRRYYGRLIMRFNSVDNIAEMLVQCAISDTLLYDDIEICAAATADDINKHLKSVFNTDNCSLSVILPAGE